MARHATVAAAAAVAALVLWRRSEPCGSAGATQLALATPVPGLLAEMPRKLLALPQDRWVGPGFDLASVAVSRPGAGRTTLNLMLDSALTTSMMAPHVASFLNLSPDTSNGGVRKFTAADGPQKSMAVKLEDTVFEGTGVGLGPLSPLVTEYPQIRIGADLGCPVDGMIGMEFYERFGVWVDSDSLRIYEADSASNVATAEGLTQLSLAPLPADLVGVEVDLAGERPSNAFHPPNSAGKVLGILDTGAAHSVLNWPAAGALLGLRQDDEALWDDGSISSQDISGRPIDMPLVSVALALRGAGGAHARGAVPFKPIEVAVGNIALFAKLLGGDTEAPAALIGQDILTQRPTLFAARQRLICFGT